MDITLLNQQTALAFDEAPLRAAAEFALAEAGITAGNLSIVVVDDPTIHELNRKFLAHDYPTDVLSFALDSRPGFLEGEVIVSAETAAAAAGDYNWLASDELLLYVIHGVLHLVGYNDKSEAEAAAMRAAERRVLAHCGVVAPPLAQEALP